MPANDCPAAVERSRGIFARICDREKFEEVWKRMLNLGSLPRRGYTSEPTPLEFLARLTEVLNGPKIYAKRDDLLPGAGGGSKTRKLDFLVQDALEKASAAAVENLPCHLVLEEHVEGSYRAEAAGNYLFFRLLGVASITLVTSGTDLNAAMERLKEQLKQQQAKPYIVPFGGSNSLGDVGYVHCGQELLEQAFNMQLRIDRIILTTASAGTHAGLLVGLHGSGSPIPTTGINVTDDPANQQCATVLKMAENISAFLGLDKNTVQAESVDVRDEFVGLGYSIPTEQMMDAVKLMARTEGIMLDPVYTGKAFAGLVAMIKSGELNGDDNVVFLHTGGTTALHVYADVFHAYLDDVSITNLLG